jgi:hypothetical protein
VKGRCPRPLDEWDTLICLGTYPLITSTYTICVNTRKNSVSKEVIQPQVPLGLPCYDFTPVMNHTVVNALPKVKLSTSGAAHSHGVTGGVYKARERIHRGILIHDY